MVRPSTPGTAGGGGEPISAELRRRRIEEAQHAAAQQVASRRRHLLAGTGAPQLSVAALLKRHVLQADFANVVPAPSPGYVECEIVIVGDRIRIYVPNASGGGGELSPAPGDHAQNQLEAAIGLVYGVASDDQAADAVPAWISILSGSVGESAVDQMAAAVSIDAGVLGGTGDHAQDQVAASVSIDGGILGTNGDHAQDAIIAGVTLQLVAGVGEHAQDAVVAGLVLVAPGGIQDHAQDEIAAAVSIDAGPVGGNGDHAQDQVTVGIVLQLVAANGDHAQDAAAALAALLVPGGAGDHAQDAVVAGVAASVATNGDQAQDAAAAALVLVAPGANQDHAQDQAAAGMVLTVAPSNGDHASDEVAASVSIETGAARILDTLSEGAQSAVAVAYSVSRQLTTSYEGALIRLRRASDDAELDFGFDGDGLLDVAAIESWCLGDGYVVTIYDQSGNGNDANQSTSSLQVQFVQSGTVMTLVGTSVPAAVGNGSDGSGRQELGVIDTPLNVGADDFTVWFAMGRAEAAQRVIGGPDHVGIRWMHSWNGSGFNDMLTADSIANSNITDPATWLRSAGYGPDSTIEPKCGIVTFESGVANVGYVNSTSEYGDNAEAGSSDVELLWIGMDVGYFSWWGEWCEMVVFDGTLLESSDRSILMTDGTSFFS